MAADGHWQGGAAVPKRPAGYDKMVALVLQGGGALGSYQAGVYETLSESEYLPDWIAGISIGAINAAIIAGNPPNRRVERLRAFWQGITKPTADWPGVSGALAETQRRAGAMGALLFGQPGFFAPMPPFAWFANGGPSSYYTTAELRSTLERLVDFDRINAREVRLSMGAVHVKSGNFIYFDSGRIKIRPEHVMASGAIPPYLPAVEIDGELYWDGGLVSNTPLQYILEYYPRRSRLCFQVDLYHARGKLPVTLDEVQERSKDIRFSSRTRNATETSKLMHDLRRNLDTLLAKLPDELKQGEEARFLREFSCVTTMDIVQLVYRPGHPEGSAKDYEFSRATMEARWAMGRSDALTTLQASPWLAPVPRGVGARNFDVMLDVKRGLQARAHPGRPSLPRPAAEGHADDAARL